MFSRNRAEEPAERPVLERGYLSRLAESLGSAETGELLSDGMLELSDRLARLRQESAKSNGQGLHELVHNIAGVAGHMGLTAMSAAAADAQRSLREDQRDRTGIEAVLSLQDSSMNALRDYCLTLMPKAED
ncbi:MAG: Hpt domain-containing protein [Pseudomonadota bacterium]